MHANTEELRALIPLSIERSERGVTSPTNFRYNNSSLDVGNSCRAAEKTNISREGGLRRDLPLFAFKTPNQCGLFVTDISTRPIAEVDIEGVARLGSFLSKGTTALGLVSLG